MFKDLKQQYRQSLKSMDTEEHIDLAFYRPIGFAWAYLFRKLHVTPNAVTVASIFIGVASGIMFYFTEMWMNIVGMLLLVWANSYDSADGQLARMTGQYSRLGRILDGMSGDFWFASIYVAICLRTVHTSSVFDGYAWGVWVLAVAAGLFHAKQAATADYYRQFYLYFLKGTGGSELDSTAELRTRLEATPWKGNVIGKLMMTIYYRYTAGQEASSPAMQELRRQLQRCYPDGNIPQDFRKEFCRLSFPLLKWENFMTFNWRTIFLFASLFAMMPWLYFVAELTVFNAVMVYTVRRHESLCRKMLNHKGI
ncbi:MAG: CDP-alcohol phosphatidyltransferase family protein [Muribaculaceae bacterium]|nr:CDP-alcohol phosphatidyltransferase family protein [Muribaculaceae bacterium]